MTDNSHMEFIFPPTIRGMKVKDETALFPIGKIYCVGKNYAAHAKEMGSEVDKKEPFFFSKPPQSLTQLKEIPYPTKTNNLHHEVELVVFLHKGGANILQEQVKDLIFGYAVGVDLTKRDLQNEFKDAGKPWDLSKGFDYSGPISEIIRRGKLLGDETITLKVNDELRQSSNISLMEWDIPSLISILSQQVTLKPGDVIFTGTPEGVGPIVKGDSIFAEITNIGSLDFIIV